VAVAAIELETSLAERTSADFLNFFRPWIRAAPMLVGEPLVIRSALVAKGAWAPGMPIHADKTWFRARKPATETTASVQIRICT